MTGGRRSPSCATGGACPSPGAVAESMRALAGRRRGGPGPRPGLGRWAPRGRLACRSTTSASARPCLTRARSTRWAQLPRPGRAAWLRPGAAAGLRQGRLVRRRPRRRPRLGPHADRERGRRVRAGRRHRPDGLRRVRRGRGRRTSSGSRSSTTSRPATRGWTATSGCWASPCPGSARWARGSSRRDEIEAGSGRTGLHDQRRADPGRAPRTRCASGSPRSSRTSAGTSCCDRAT